MSEPTPSIRTEAEVQRAHDIIVGIIVGEAPAELTPQDENLKQGLERNPRADKN